MDVVVTINEFISHLKARGYAHATIESYTRNIGQFGRYLQQRDLDSLKKVTPEVIDQYRQTVMGQSIAAESKALKIRPVKRLFEYLADNHRLLVNPTEGIVEISRKHRRIGTVLTVEEAKRLLAQPDLSCKIGVRNQAIMAVLYATGIRRNELLSLKTDDADLKENALYIRKGKGGKERVVPMGKNAAKHLAVYLGKVRPVYICKRSDERALFVNRFGRRLSGGSIQAFLTKYRLAAAIAKPVSPHTLRRSCATHLLQQGADIRYIQQLLGHKHLSTTQMYTKVAPMDVKATHDRTHPQL
jgi:integrase/recombinase XerD